MSQGNDSISGTGVIMAQDIASAANVLAPKDLRLVMLGRTGAGMTCTANSILHDHLFEERVDTRSKTHRCDLVQRTINSQRISIIDTPGFYNTEMSEKSSENEIDRCVSLAYPGPHAFLLVISMTNRFPPEAQNMIRRMEAKFGRDIYKYLIVVFTGKDTLDHENRDFADFLQDGLHPMIADVLRKCNNHCVPFNNKADAQENAAQVKSLLDMVEQVVAQNSDRFYSTDAFNSAAQRIRRKAATTMTKIGGIFNLNIRTIYILMILLMLLCTVTSFFTFLGFFINFITTPNTGISPVRQQHSEVKEKHITPTEPPFDINEQHLGSPDNLEDPMRGKELNNSVQPLPPVESYHYTQTALSTVGQGICLNNTNKNRCIGYWFDPSNVLPPLPPLQSYLYYQILLSSASRGICPKPKNRCVGYWFDINVLLPSLDSYSYTQIMLSSVRQGMCINQGKEPKTIGYWFDPGLPKGTLSILYTAVSNNLEVISNSLGTLWSGLYSPM